MKLNARFYTSPRRRDKNKGRKMFFNFKPVRHNFLITEHYTKLLLKELKVTIHYSLIIIASFFKRLTMNSVRSL